MRFSHVGQGREPDRARYPLFREQSRLMDEVQRIKAELWEHLDGAITYARSRGLLADGNTALSAKDRRCIQLALSAHLYGAIYFFSTHDARADASFIDAHAADIVRWAARIEQVGCANRLWNYAIHSFVQAPGRAVRYGVPYMPPYAIATVARDRLCVDGRFRGEPGESFDKARALGDLHDFSHMACASVSPKLHGCQYFDDLLALPKELGRLIKPGYATERYVPFSDPFVFTELTLQSYNARVSIGSDDGGLVEAMAGELCRYYLGEAAMFVPSLAKYVRSPAPVEPEQLAVLVQNKSYEAVASEAEVAVFVRGGQGELDPLRELDAYQRLRAIGGLEHRLYFEHRNTIRHRAHLRAYEYVLSELRARTGDHWLLDEIAHHLNYDAQAASPSDNLYLRISEQSKRRGRTLTS